MGQVKKGSELLMIVEASGTNWFDQADPKRADLIGKIHLRRLGARHGKVSADGANAQTNMAFFDGHVALFPVEKFESPKEVIWSFRDETIFVLGMQ